jgi:hypothetical protein
MAEKNTRVAGIGGDGELYGVTEVTGAGGYMCRPCPECPWRTDSPLGRFPADAYRESAPTSYDMAERTFGCHMSGADKPATCAGFLLRNADHNLAVRLACLSGTIDLADVDEGGIPLYRSYRAMAVANGVPARDPSLAPSRANHE